MLSIFNSDDIVDTCAKRGNLVSLTQCFKCRIADRQLRRRLEEELGDHPHVGEIRGRGLFLSLEFVKDRQTKATFSKALPLSSMLDNAIFKRGVSVYSGFGKGTADGVVGDHILFSPPLNISPEEIEELVLAVKGGVDEVFALPQVRAEL